MSDEGKLIIAQLEAHQALCHAVKILQDTFWTRMQEKSVEECLANCYDAINTLEKMMPIGKDKQKGCA